MRISKMFSPIKKFRVVNFVPLHFDITAITSSENSETVLQQKLSFLANYYQKNVFKRERMGNALRLKKKQSNLSNM